MMRTTFGCRTRRRTPTVEPAKLLAALADEVVTIVPGPDGSVTVTYVQAAPFYQAYRVGVLAPRTRPGT